MKISYIYALTDPDTNDVRYIGYARNPWTRLENHVAESKYSNAPCHRLNWIRSISNVGKKPGLEVIAVIPQTMAKEMEKSVIQLAKANGFKLTNNTDGGDGKIGYVTPLATRQKLSTKLRAAWERKTDDERSEWARKSASARVGGIRSAETVTKLLSALSKTDRNSPSLKAKFKQTRWITSMTNPNFKQLAAMVGEL